ncbi:MAG: hypothetical protein KF802_02355 [Bdellovibrionaceae bacterium]|nr:hypothetical protein [Pseudobdellovibrionaceae bacterium]
MNQEQMLDNLLKEIENYNVNLLTLAWSIPNLEGSDPLEVAMALLRQLKVATILNEQLEIIQSGRMDLLHPKIKSRKDVQYANLGFKKEKSATTINAFQNEGQYIAHLIKLAKNH